MLHEAGILAVIIAGLVISLRQTPQLKQLKRFKLELTELGIGLLFILLAGVNLLVFRLTVFDEVMRLGPGDDAPLLAKFIGGTSLFLWLGVIWWGRMIMFT